MFSDFLGKSKEISENFRTSIAPILEQRDKIKNLFGSVYTPIFDIQKPDIPTMSFDIVNQLTENNVMQELTGMGATIKELYNSNVVRTIGELAVKSAIPKFQFENPVLKVADEWTQNIVSNLSAGLNALVESPILKEIHSITSNLGKWLQTVDFSPLTSIIENISSIGFEYDYQEVDEVFLKAMFDAKWFPYAGWFADYRMVEEMLEILDTSRASKNRIKRIDKLIFSYYDKDEIDNFKRGWRQMNLPSYMTRILVQSVQAYHRKEYALTVSALSTIWEGIIQEKANDDSYRVSRKTRENLAKLIDENEFDKIFSSFCEEFIFYNCNKPEEVKPDVPGRHGIAHCWYNTYPNRKVALNAILFTDFLIRLKPLDELEE